MYKQAEAVRDVFAFSRGGLTVIASFVAAPIIDSDQINKARDQHVRRARATRSAHPEQANHAPEQVGAAQTA